MIQAPGGLVWKGMVLEWVSELSSSGKQRAGDRISNPGWQLATKGLAPGCGILAVVGALVLGLTLQCAHRLEGSIGH